MDSNHIIVANICFGTNIYSSGSRSITKALKLHLPFTICILCFIINCISCVFHTSHVLFVKSYFINYMNEIQISYECSFCNMNAKHVIHVPYIHICLKIRIFMCQIHTLTIDICGHGTNVYQCFMIKRHDL